MMNGPSIQLMRPLHAAEASKLRKPSRSKKIKPRANTLDHRACGVKTVFRNPCKDAVEIVIGLGPNENLHAAKRRRLSSNSLRVSGFRVLSRCRRCTSDDPR
jgi:hypothetical protein